MDIMTLIGLLARAKFRDFDESDWDFWSGCEMGENPKIAKFDGKEIIVDGNIISVYDEDRKELYDGEHFQVTTNSDTYPLTVAGREVR